MPSPIKISLKTEMLPIIIIVATFVLGFYFYAHFPAQVASHWNFQGDVDSYSSRTTGAFAIPLLLLGIYILFLVLPFMDPKRDRYAEFEKVYRIFKNMLLLFMLAIYVALGLFNLGYPINISYVVPPLVGLLFIILGSYMGKIKSNWLMGIRTPWTLSSENVWNKTHRVGGWMFIIFGVIIAVTPFLPEAIELTILIGGIVLILLGSFGASYIFYLKEKKLK